jgi:uncharacterized membrane protein
MSYDGLYNEAPPPRVRFETIGEAWTLFQQQMGAWLGAGAMATAALFAFIGLSSGFFIVPLLATSAVSKEPNVGVALGGMFLGILLMTVGAVLLGGLLSAGFYRMAHKQVHLGTVAISDFFDIKDIFWPMLGMSFLVGLATSAASQFFAIPGLILGGLWMLAGPLIADRRMGIIQAMSASWRALQHDLIMASCYYLVVSLLATVGIFLLGIGIIFTMPLMYLGLALVYRDFFPDPVSDR